MKSRACATPLERRSLDWIHVHWGCGARCAWPHRRRTRSAVSLRGEPPGARAPVVHRRWSGGECRRIRSEQVRQAASAEAGAEGGGAVVMHPFVWLSALRAVTGRPTCLSARELTAYALYLASRRQLKSGTMRAIRIFGHVQTCSECREAGEELERQHFPESAPPKIRRKPILEQRTARVRR